MKEDDRQHEGAFAAAARRTWLTESPLCDVQAPLHSELGVHVLTENQRKNHAIAAIVEVLPALRADQIGFAVEQG